MKGSLNDSTKTGAGYAPASPDSEIGLGPVPLLPRSGTPLGIGLEQALPPDRASPDSRTPSCLV